MALLRVGALADLPLDAAAQFHARVVQQARDLREAGCLTLLFAPADHTHRAWRTAAVQGLARELAPVRVNAIASDDEVAIAAASAYLDRAEGVTGQYLPLDSAGAGEVIG